MGNPQSPTSRGLTPPAQLRENVLAYFEVDDLESLCFDLGVDYSGLPGDGKAAKVVAMLEYFGRTGRVVDLIDRCAQLRPNVTWDALRAAALATPDLFRPISPDELATTTGKSLLNLPPDRALRIGIIVGAILVLVLLCGFSGGILASNFVSVTLKPVSVSPSAGAAAAGEIAALPMLGSGESVQLAYDDVKATSLADTLLVQPDSPVSEVHVQFLQSGDIGMNVRLKTLGNRRVVLGMDVRTENGRLVLAPKSVALNVLEIPGSTFGWIAMPTDLVNPFITWLQSRLDQAAHTYWFQAIHVTKGSMTLDLRKR
jgi:Effector-associated domain 7